VIAEAPKVVAEVPKAIAEAPKVIAEAPKVVVEVPKAIVEAPKAIAEAPKVVVEAPKAIAEVPKAVAEMPLSGKVTVVESAPTPAGKSANAKPVQAIGETAIAKASAPLPQAITDEFMGLLTLGTNLTDRADYNSAEIAFHQILKAPGVPLPTTKGALLGLARMHRKQGELTKAVAIYEKFLKEYPTDDRVPDALLDLGRTLRAMGAYRGAIARFYSVINSTLKLPEEGFERYQLLAKTAQFEIAETHYETGDYTEASKFFLRLRQLDLAPADRARAHFKAAYAFHLSGNHETSVTTLHAYLDQCPDDENVPEARYLLAINLRKLKRSQEALAATLELLSTEKSKMNADPKRWTYWQRRTGNQLANDFFDSGDTMNAQVIYTSLLSLSNEPGWTLSITYQIALCYERLGATELAGKSYQRIIESAGPTPSQDLAELTQMASWRLDHLGWRENTQRQLTNFFETTTGKSPVPPPAPKVTSNQP
jgi:tetratricopeptide (TPR) repeat protein